MRLFGGLIDITRVKPDLRPATNDPLEYAIREAGLPLNHDLLIEAECRLAVQGVEKWETDYALAMYKALLRRGAATPTTSPDKEQKGTA